MFKVSTTNYVMRNSYCCFWAMLGLSTNFLHCVFENVTPVAAARKSIWVCQTRPPEQPPPTHTPPPPLHSRTSRHGAWSFVTFNKKIRLVNFIYIFVSNSKRKKKTMKAKMERNKSKRYRSKIICLRKRHFLCTALVLDKLFALLHKSCPA